MVFGVATPGGVSTGPSSSTFFPENPIATTAAGALRISKPALASRAKSYAASPEQEDSLIAKIIEAIRRFFARICRAFLPASSSKSADSDNSLKKAPGDMKGRSGDMTGGLSSEAGARPSMAETDEELTLHGLSEKTLERVQQTVTDLIASVEGTGLSESVRSALSLTSEDQRTTFRVLLQHNLSDTLKIRSEARELESDIESLISPYADEHGLTAKQAVALLRADLESGGSFIANRVDPNCELRGRVAELQRLNSSLAGLARGRGQICAAAIESGSYPREELGTLIAQQGFDTEFLFRPEQVVDGPSAVDDEKTNVISLANYKDGGNVLGPVGTPSGTTMVKDAIRVLVSHGVIEPEVEAEDKIVQAAAVDEVLSDEAEFETEMHGDDLGDFLSGRNASKPKPRI